MTKKGPIKHCECGRPHMVSAVKCEQCCRRLSVKASKPMGSNVKSLLLGSAAALSGVGCK